MGVELVYSKQALFCVAVTKHTFSNLHLFNSKFNEFKGTQNVKHGILINTLEHMINADTKRGLVSSQN